MGFLDRPLIHRSLEALSNALASGEVTATDLCEEALEQAQATTDRAAHVFISLDADKIRTQAKAMDMLRSVNAEPSRFAGIPISIKDLADVKGEVTASGSKINASDAPASEDAPVIARLRQAGFVLFGRTNMTEYAYSGLGLNPHYGTPGNSLDHTRAPGGSSSGAAVSVGLGMSAAALGSDTGGSVRAPSAVNGLAGFKPTSSAVPTQGIFPLSPTLDSIGPLAPTVSCCRTLHGVFSASSEPVQRRPVQDLRLAVVPTLLQDDLDQEVSDAFEAALRALDDQGATLEVIAAPHLMDIAEISPRINFAGAEAYAFHRGMILARPNDFDARVRERIKLGAAMTASDYAELIALRQHVWRQHHQMFAGYDAILAPTCPILAPKLDIVEGDVDVFFNYHGLMLRNTSLFNWLDTPAATVPIQAPGEQGVGLMICGLPGQDWQTLTIAEVIEGAVRQ